MIWAGAWRCNIDDAFGNCFLHKGLGEGVHIRTHSCQWYLRRTKMDNFPLLFLFSWLQWVTKQLHFKTSGSKVRKVLYLQDWGEVEPKCVSGSERRKNRPERHWHCTSSFWLPFLDQGHWGWAKLTKFIVRLPTALDYHLCLIIFPVPPPSHPSAKLSFINLRSQGPGRGVGLGQGAEARILLDLAPQWQGSFALAAASTPELDLMGPPVYSGACASSVFPLSWSGAANGVKGQCANYTPSW